MENKENIVECSINGQLALFSDYNNEPQSEDNSLRSIAIIDGLNVAYSRNDNHARFEDIIRTEKLLSQHFDEVEIFIDASGLHKIDNKKALEDLINKGKIVLCPARTMADDIIWIRGLSLANRNYIVWIVTNDMFPMTRHYDKEGRIRNLTVTIMRSGDIYLLEREIKYLDAKSTFEVKTEVIEPRDENKG
jgi:hypothetical protein